MNRSILIALVAFSLFMGLDSAQITSGNMVFVKANETAKISLPAAATYRRIAFNVGGEEHLYRVCNGKNKAKCGFWENVTTKKKVASGTTTYNKSSKKLIIKQVRVTDFGAYMTGNKKKTIELHQMW